MSDKNIKIFVWTIVILCVLGIIGLYVLDLVMSSAFDDSADYEQYK